MVFRFSFLLAESISSHHFDFDILLTLEIRKVVNEKKEALATQFAAVAALRRVHATQREDNYIPCETVVAPQV
jgi:hypothetical protein